MEDLAEYQYRHSPQEVDALMAHSGLSLADAVCPNSAAPVRALPEFNDDAGQKYWLAVCPRAIFRRYFTYRMNIISRFVCRALGRVSRGNFANFWNCWRITFRRRTQHRAINLVTITAICALKRLTPRQEQQKRIIAEAEEISMRAHIRESRHNALKWLRGLLYSVIWDDNALWANPFQRSIVEKVGSTIISDDTIKFAPAIFLTPAGCIIFARMRSKRNSQCRKSVVVTSTPGY